MAIAYAHVSDLHVGDFIDENRSGTGRARFLAVLADIRRRGIGDLILSGDLGSPEALPWVAATLRASGLRWLLALGNHDEIARVRSVGLDPPESRPAGGARGTRKLRYRIDGPEGTFVFLDTSAYRVGRGQRAWLAGTLRTAADPITVFAHHPVLDCGNTLLDRLFPLRDRDETARVLLDSGRRVTWVCGHYHFAHEQTVGPVTQYVTPSALVQFRKDADEVIPDGTAFGYRVLTFGADGWDTEVVFLEDEEEGNDP